MRQFRGQVAVVGEQQYAGGVAVEAAYGIDAFGAGIAHDVHDVEAALGVVRGRYAIFGLVEQHIDFVLGQHHFVVVGDDIVAGDFRSQFGHHFAVDFDFALLYELIGFSARAHARVGQELVETYRFVGVDHALVIDDATGYDHSLLAVVASAVGAALVAAIGLVVASAAVVESLTVASLLAERTVLAHGVVVGLFAVIGVRAVGAAVVIVVAVVTSLVVVGAVVAALAFAMVAVVAVVVGCVTVEVVLAGSIVVGIVVVLIMVASAVIVVPAVVVAVIVVVGSAVVVVVVVVVVATGVIYLFVFFIATFAAGCPSCLSDARATGFLFFFHNEFYSLK